MPTPSTRSSSHCYRWVLKSSICLVARGWMERCNTGGKPWVWGSVPEREWAIWQTDGSKGRRSQSYRGHCMREIWKESMNFVEQSTTKFELGRSFQDAEGLMKPYWYGLRPCLSRSENRRWPERSAAVLEAKRSGRSES